MRQTRWRPAVFTLLLALGLTVARAEDNPQGPGAPAQAPTCCCEKPQSASSPCSSEACSATPCCRESNRAKSTNTLAVHPCKTLDGGIEQSLATLYSFHFSNTPLREVLDDLRALSGLNLVADEPALAEAGIRLDRPVTLGLKGVSLKKALELLLHQVQLTYVVADDVLQITTPSQVARTNLVTKMYAVADLIQPHTGLGRPTHAAKTETSDPELIQLITRTVCPATWSGCGGSGTMEYFPVGQSLAVTQTPDVHEQVAELLATLRRLREHETACTGPTCVPAGPGMVHVVAEPTSPSLVPTVLSSAAATPLTPCVVHESAKPVSQPWAVSVVVKQGQAQLEVQSGSETRLLCKEMVLETLGGQVQLCTCDKQIQLTSPFFEAAADRLSRTETEDGVILEGHVWLQCHEDVQHAEVFAERVVVSLKDGHLEIKR